MMITEHALTAMLGIIWIWITYALNSHKIVQVQILSVIVRVVSLDLWYKMVNVLSKNVIWTYAGHIIRIKLNAHHVPAELIWRTVVVLK